MKHYRFDSREGLPEGDLAGVGYKLQIDTLAGGGQFSVAQTTRFDCGCHISSVAVLGPEGHWEGQRRYHRLCRHHAATCPDRRPEAA